MPDESRSRYYLAEWRAERFKTQEELEAESGVDQSTISSIEREPFRGRHKSTIERLCRALNVTLAELRQPPPHVQQAPVKKTETEITLEEAMKGIKRFMAHGDLTLEDLLAELLTVRAERKKRGLE